MLTVCTWCLTPLEVEDNYNDLQHSVVCSQGCRDAETLFRMFYDDEEMNRRAHYHSIMKGLSDEQSDDK